MEISHTHFFPHICLKILLSCHCTSPLDGHCALARGGEGKGLAMAVINILIDNPLISSNLEPMLLSLPPLLIPAQAIWFFQWGKWRGLLGRGESQNESWCYRARSLGVFPIFSQVSLPSWLTQKAQKEKFWREVPSQSFSAHMDSFFLSPPLSPLSSIQEIQGRESGEGEQCNSFQIFFFSSPTVLNHFEKASFSAQYEQLYTLL